MRRLVIAIVVVALGAGCMSVNVAEERDRLLAADREWSQTVGDSDKFLAYFAPDATVYMTGAPPVTGADAIRKSWTEMSSAPGFSLKWTPERAEVGSSGDIGYTSGTFDMGAEKGTYVTTWRKVDGAWKVTNDIPIPGAAPASQAKHIMATAEGLKWGDAPPGLPPGAKVAVIAGDPTAAGPFAIRVQMPMGYRIPSHWHPTDENMTVLSGTVAVGMGDAFDEAGLMELRAGGYAVMPAKMNHFAAAKTAATIQVAGMGPFEITYVNPADDPRKAAK